MSKPNLIVILIDDLRYDEFGAGGHPYMKTPNIDRIANEGAIFERAFHTTPICSPNRASIVTGQYAGRHGIIDNVARDGMSHRLDNYHSELRRLGYETAHIGKWHMGNDGRPRKGYDRWISFDGHGRLVDPKLNVDGEYTQARGYITDLLNQHALDFLEKPRSKPFALFLAHKAVHPDAFQAADGTLDLENQGGYIAAERHKDLYRGKVFPKKPNMQAAEEILRQKPIWAEAFELRKEDKARSLLRSIHSGEQEEIRLRAAMMASVDEGVGMMFDALGRQRQLDNTFILFLGDNGYFFGEHGLGPERRFAYEEGIRSPFIVRFPPLVKAKSRRRQLVICQDIAPTLIELAGGKPGPQIQGRSLVPLFASRPPARWRGSFLIEYWAEQALPWLIGMSYKAVRTERYKYIHWVNRGRKGELDELYDLQRDPFEVKNLISSKPHAATLRTLKRELRTLLPEAKAI